MTGRPHTIAVIGAGIAGLTAANFLRRNGREVTVFEGGKQIAGLARSYVDEQGFQYDFGAHFLTNRLAAAVGIGSQCRDVRYYGESVLVNGKTYSYPFGLLTVPRYVLSGVRAKLGGFGTITSAADRFRAEFGKELADEISLPILEAWSGASADRLSAAVGDKLQNSILKTIYLKLSGRLQGRAVAIGYSHEMPEGPNIWHVYPDGGVATLCDSLAADLRDRVEMESPVEKIYVENERVVGIRVRGEDRPVAAVVSTVPCSVLPKLISGSDALQPLAHFRFRPMVFVCMRFDRSMFLEDTVLWTAGCGFPFFRLTETTRSMPWLAPPGKTLVTADIGCELGDAVWTEDDESLGKRCVDALASRYRGIRDSYAGCRVLRTPIAYPVYLSEYEADRQRFEQGTGIAGLYSIGRNGEFAHILMEDIYWKTLRRMHALLQEEKTTYSPPPPESSLEESRIALRRTDPPATAPD